MAKPPTIMGFLKSFGDQWVTKMSGPLTVPFALAALIVPQRWLKVLSAILAALCALVSSYGVWSKERAARNTADEKAEKLTWPPDRPKISFVRWRLVENETGARTSQNGFYLANDGGVALEVNVERFSIDQTLSASSATVARIEGGKQGFAPIWLENEPNLTRWALDVALEVTLKAKIANRELQQGQALAIPVSVVYRDFNNLWYRSVGGLTYVNGRIDFTSVQQKCHGLTKPAPKVPQG